VTKMAAIPAARGALLAVTSFLACWSSGAFGAEPEVPKERSQELAARLYAECGEQEGFPGAVAICVRDKEKAFGKELDQAYKKALTLAGTNTPLFRENQRNWLKYQESNCKLHGQLAIESVYKSSNEAGCLLQMTMERLEELRATLEQLEESAR
jgi:uncharacterized protein YecT (DUF1311 family)